MPQAITTKFVLLTALLLAASRLSAQTTVPGGFTDHDRVKADVAFNRRTLVDAFDHDGHAPTKYDPAARDFLGRMAERFGQVGYDPIYCDDVDVSLAAVQELAAPLTHVDDPLVEYCRAVVLKDAGETKAYEALMRTAAPRAIAGQYPPARRAYGAAALVRLDPKDAALIKQRDDLVIAFLTAPTVDPLERRARVRYVVNELWHANGAGTGKGDANRRQPLLDGLAADAKTDPWLLATLRGFHEIDWAWEYRGSGWASTVTDAGWNGFRAHVTEARKQLIDAFNLEPNYPEAPAAMITVCMAEDGQPDDPREWFEHATNAQIDYMPAWQNYGELLRPRWLGSMDKLRELGREALKTRRFDTVAPLFALTSLQMMHDENAEKDAVYREPGVWDEVAATIDGYLNPPVAHLNVTWWKSRRAALAWRTGKFTEAVKGLKELGDAVNDDAFTGFDTTVAEVRDECAARLGPHGPQLRAINKDEATLLFGRARQAYDDLLEASPPDDPARPFCLRRQRCCAVAATLADGHAAAIPLTGPDDLLPWAGIDHDPRWSAVDGTLTFTGEANADTIIVHRAPLPAKCRVRLEWTYSAPAGRAPGFGVYVQNIGVDGMVDVGNYPFSRVVTLETHRWTFAVKKPPESPIDLPPDVWHTLDILHDGRAITVTEDGAKLFDAQQDAWFAFGTPVVGLHVRNGPVTGTVRVRKLTVEPVP